mgnify:CR=1 FL=1
MENDKCKNLASIKRFWPGREPDAVCVEHAQDSNRIANAMGFSLRLEPLGYSVGSPLPTDFPRCCCSRGFSQTINVGEPSNAMLSGTETEPTTKRDA